MEDIGARIVIDPGASVATLDAATDAVARLQDALLKLGVTADASMAKVGKAADASVLASGKVGAAEEDAALVGAGAIGTKTKATKAAGAAAEDAASKSEKLKNSLIKMNGHGARLRSRGACGGEKFVELPGLPRDGCQLELNGRRGLTGKDAADDEHAGVRAQSAGDDAFFDAGDAGPLCAGAQRRERRERANGRKRWL